MLISSKRRGPRLAWLVMAAWVCATSARAAPSMPQSNAANFNLSGTVFEDVSYGGGAGRDRAASGGVGRGSVRVELYATNGSFISSVNTQNNGNYAFNAIAAGTYTVRVVNGTVSSSRIGYLSGSHFAVQTYRTNAASGSIVAVTDHVGGQNPTVADAASGFAGVSMNTATGAFTAGLSGVAQSIATVNLGSNLNGVDFGFNFDVVVNTNNAGQGSLRQFLINANGLANAGLAQVGRAAGIDNAVFMLADGTARPGSHTGYPNLFVGGIATITPTSALPSITDPVVLNGETQAGWSGSPIVELKGTGNAIDGLTVTAGSSTIRGLVIDGFGGNGVVLATGGFNTITGNYIGTAASGASASANGRDGIYVNGSSNNQIGGLTAGARNIIAGNDKIGVEIVGAASTANQIQGNYVGVSVSGDRAVRNLENGIAVSGGASVHRDRRDRGRRGQRDRRQQCQRDERRLYQCRQQQHGSG